MCHVNKNATPVYKDIRCVICTLIGSPSSTVFGSRDCSFSMLIICSFGGGKVMGAKDGGTRAVKLKQR